MSTREDLVAIFHKPVCKLNKTIIYTVSKNNVIYSYLLFVCFFSVYLIQYWYSNRKGKKDVIKMKK